MIKRHSSGRRFAVFLAAALAALSSRAGANDFLSPGGSVTTTELQETSPGVFEPVETGVFDWPVPDWTRGDSGSAYAEWDSFTVAFGAPGNLPDVGNVNAATATVEQTTGPLDDPNSPFDGAGAFITSSGNIYSFATVNSFEVNFPSVAAETSGRAYFVVQVKTLGTPLEDNSFQLFYGSDPPLAPDGVVVTREESVGFQSFSGVNQTKVAYWELNGLTSVEDLRIEFSAAADSLNLDQLVIDTFFPAAAAVPGDYDGSGYVDHQDYLYWRSRYATADLSADGNGDLTVDSADYTVWRNNFGAGTPPAGGGSGGLLAAVPEPGGAAVAVVLLSTAAFCGWVPWFNRPRRGREETQK